MFTRSQRTWNEFVRALTRSREPFNPFVWIYRLTAALLEDLGAESTFLFHGLQCWRPAIPILAFCLIGGVVVSYFLVFRRSIVAERWCDSSHHPRRCRWMTVHDGTVIYLTVMTIYAFLTTMCTSPGIHLSSKHHVLQEQSKTEVERGSVARFGDFEHRQQSKQQQQQHPMNDSSLLCDQNGGGVFVHPSPAASRCEICDHDRPPRCHHCKICNRCVLVYDHHCFFLNRCIGYNNYRAFFQTILFVTIGCWYGVSILYKPFYEPVQDYLKGHGGMLALVRSSIEHGRLPPDFLNFFATPTLAEFWAIATGRNHHKLHQTVLDAVFPLVFAVGSMMALFLGSHVKSVLRATTTLEHKVVLDRMFRNLGQRMMDRKTREERWINPFDQGSAVRNWSTALGSNPLLLFLPVPVLTPPPFLPVEKHI